MNVRISITTVLLSMVAIATCSGVDAFQQTETQSTDGSSEAPDTDVTAGDMPQRWSDGPIDLELRWNTHSVQVAEPFQVELVIQGPDGTDVILPEIGESLGPFDVVDRQQVRAVPIDGRENRRQWIDSVSLESVISGEQEVPALKVEYRLPSDAPGGSPLRFLSTMPFTVNVTSLLEPDQDPTEYREIKDEITTPAASHKVRRRWIALGVAVILAGALFGLWWWSRERPPSPLQWACQEIDKIELDAESNSIATDDVYSRLSQVLRRFLELEYQVPTTSLSTEEMDNALQARSFHSTTVSMITQFLADADVVKFSQRIPSPAVASESPVDRVRRIIHDICDSPGTPHQGN